MALRAGDDRGDAGDSMLEKDIQKQEFTGIFQSCQWFKAKPLQRWTFGVMLLFAIFTPIWLIIKATGGPTGDILAGLCGIILACYAANHFRILLGLKEQVDRFGKLNRDFKVENAQLKSEVNRLSRAQQELGATSDRLKETTKQYAENIEKFKDLDEKLSKLADDNIAGLEKLQEMSREVQDSIQKELVQHERDILMRVQESMEFGDDKEGLSYDEYKRFIDALPLTFQERFNALDKDGNDDYGFSEVAGDDGEIDMDEFTKLCDDFAIANAKHGGSR